MVFVVDGIDRFTTVRMPWHDIACVVFNKAATDVGRHFIQRWNHAKKVKASSKSSSKYPLLRPRSTKTTYKRLPSFIKDICELVNVQVRLSCGTYSAQIHAHFIIIDIWLLTVYWYKCECLWSNHYVENLCGMQCMYICTNTYT